MSCLSVTAPTINSLDWHKPAQMWSKMPGRQKVKVPGRLTNLSWLPDQKSAEQLLVSNKSCAPLPLSPLEQLLSWWMSKPCWWVWRKRKAHLTAVWDAIFFYGAMNTRILNEGNLWGKAAVYAANAFKSLWKLQSSGKDAFWIVCHTVSFKRM